MKRSEARIGQRVIFNIKSPYTDEQILSGFDPAVVGRTGTLFHIGFFNDKHFGEVQLDEPLVFEDEEYEVYTDSLENMDILKTE